MFNKLRSRLGLRKSDSVHEYGRLFLDHLNCDYLLVESKITDPQDKKIIAEIIDKKNNRQLNWEDIRAFDMVVLKYQDFETIKGKMASLRKRFEGILSQAELEQYKASPKIDLATVTPAQIEELRAEYSGLAREFCLRYSYMASREGLRSLLLRSGAALTIIFCLLMAVIAVIIFQNSTDGAITGEGGIKKWLNYLSSFATLLMVVFAGITGAFVSMQQRIQSVSYKGDPIADLSILTHGWLSIFLSPLSGAIFAGILYLFFAGQILSGTVFPEFIGLPENTGLEITANDQTISQPVPIRLVDFLITTGPKAGKDFAMLMIWCFIAGFAERFVPDALNRLVSKEGKSENSNT